MQLPDPVPHYNCSQRNDPILLPPSALASMTVYDLDTSDDGEYPTLDGTEEQAEAHAKASASAPGPTPGSAPFCTRRVQVDPYAQEAAPADGPSRQ